MRKKINKYKCGGDGRRESGEEKVERERDVAGRRHSELGGKRIRWTVGRRSKLGDKILGLERERYGAQEMKRPRYGEGQLCNRGGFKTGRLLPWSEEEL